MKLQLNQFSIAKMRLNCNILVFEWININGYFVSTSLVKRTQSEDLLYKQSNLYFISFGVGNKASSIDH